MVGVAQRLGHGMPCPYGYRWPECLNERERAGWLAPFRLLLDFGAGERAPTCWLLCWLAADDDGVALVAAGVDIADGDVSAVGFRDRNPAVAGRSVAAVPDDPAVASDRDVAVAAVCVRDRGAAVGADVDGRLVGDRAAVDRDVAALDALDHDRVARVAAGVDVADGDRAAIGLGHRDSAVPGCRVATVADDATAAGDRDVVVTAVGIGDRRAAVRADGDGGGVAHGAAVDADVRGSSEQAFEADQDSVAAVVAGVDVADRDRAAVGLRHRYATETGRRVSTVAKEPTGAGHGDIAIATVGIGDGEAAIGAQRQRRLVGDRATVDRHVARTVAARRGAGADGDGVAGVVAGVDVVEVDHAAVGLGDRHTGVASRGVAAVPDDTAAT